MKKFICFILVSILLFAALSITASAADTPKSAYRVDWSALSYNAYWYNEKNDDISKYFTVSTTQNSIVLKAKGKSERRAYVAKTRFEITADTKYEYVFQAKTTVIMDIAELYLLLRTVFRISYTDRLITYPMNLMTESAIFV